jgi:hypothetical protein
MLNCLIEVKTLVHLLNTIVRTKKWSTLITLLFCTVLSYAQVPISAITDASPLPTSIPITRSGVNAAPDALGAVQANQPYDINYGAGDNLKIAS